jgi:uncharacterized protein YbaP (TraB family)
MGMRRLLGAALLALATPLSSASPAALAAPNDPAATAVGAISRSRSDSANPQPPHGYAQLPAPKALARPTDGSNAGDGVAYGARSDLAAAQTALEGCRGSRQTPAPCELVWLNDEPIATADEIRHGLAAANHPLFLWRYTSGVATLHLAGSIHILKESLLPLPAQFDGAFAASDQLVVEVDVVRHGAELQGRTAELAFLQGDATLTALAPAELRARLAERLPRYDLTPAKVERATPALVAQQLLISRLLALGYHPEHGMEQYYLARRGERPVLELESVESQLALLFGQPMDVQLALLAEAVGTEASLGTTVADLLRAWFAGDDAAFLAAFAAGEGANPLLGQYERALVAERNRAMAERIAALLETPGRYFVLVGAGHLVGESSIVALLAERGIEGRRIRSTDPP